MERNKGKVRTIRYGCWWVKKTILPKSFGNSSNRFCSALASVTKKVCLEKCKSSTCVSAYSATQESKTYWCPWNFEENNRKSCSFSNTGRVYFVSLISGGMWRLDVRQLFTSWIRYYTMKTRTLYYWWMPKMLSIRLIKKNLYTMLDYMPCFRYICFKLFFQFIKFVYYCRWWIKICS